MEVAPSSPLTTYNSISVSDIKDISLCKDKRMLHINKVKMDLTHKE